MYHQLFTKIGRICCMSHGWVVILYKTHCRTELPSHGNSLEFMDSFNSFWEAILQDSKLTILSAAGFESIQVKYLISNSCGLKLGAINIHLCYSLIVVFSRSYRDNFLVIWLIKTNQKDWPGTDPVILQKTRKIVKWLLTYVLVKIKTDLLNYINTVSCGRVCVIAYCNISVKLHSGRKILSSC